MFSEALAILDRNTEIYMFEELQKQVEELKNIKTDYEKDIVEKINIIETQTAEIETQKTEIETQKTEIETQKDKIAALTEELEKLKLSLNI